MNFLRGVEGYAFGRLRQGPIASYNPGLLCMMPLSAKTVVVAM